MCAEVLYQRHPVTRSALRTPRGVELEIQAAVAQTREQRPRHGHDLEVHSRVYLTQDFDVELVKLTIPAGLGPIVTKDRADRIELDRLREDVHPVLDVSAHHARGELRAAA